MLTIILILLFGWFVSGVVHELGHAIIGKMARLNIEYFQLIPHGVSFSGKTSDSWFAAISIAGPIFPVLIGIVGVLTAILFKEKYPYVSYSLWVFIPMMMQSFILLCAPIARAFGVNESNGDITKFLELAKWHPLAVSLVGLVLVACCVVVLKMAI